MERLFNLQTIDEFLLDITETAEYKRIEYLIFSIRMETMMMTDTTAMMIMLPVWMMLLMTMMRTGKIVGGVLICHRMDTVEMKAFHMMENRKDVAVARATAGMIMMANSKEGGQSETI